MPLPRALLAPRRALLADLLQPAPEQRDLAPRDPAVGLELRLAGAARADAGAERARTAAEALEVLPHAAHARQVVLELRELDLELSLGARRVLGEDVEDQLRPVDDARRQGVLERALLRRLELVVDDQDLGVGVLVGLLQLLELALADVRPRIGVRALLHELGDRLDAGRARELAQLAELLLGVGGASGARRERARARARRPSRLSGASSPGDCATLAPMPDLADRLAERTLELVDIPSESRHEAEIAAHVRSLVPPSFEPEYEADDAFVWARPRREGAPLVVLAGHYDTVPAQENIPGRIENGAVVGLGASDMKGGLAVMLELARELEERGVEPAVDVALLAFGKEELPAEFSPLPHLFDNSRVVHDAELAILLEPTDNTIQAGCLGNLNARITFHGVSGHSARPWTAENAIEKALDGLRAYAAIEPRPVEIGGLTFTEVASITQIEGGIATNVIPDRVEANVNFRYAPDRSPASADAYLRSLLPRVRRTSTRATRRRPASSPTRRSCSACARRAISRSSRSRRGRTSPTSPRAGSTRSTSGPGATRYAHRRDEQVEIEALERAFAALWRFVTGSV